MKHFRKIVIPMSMDENIVPFLKKELSSEILRGAEVQFIHIFNTITFYVGVAPVPLIYPIEPDRKAIEESILSLLSVQSQDVLGKHFDGKISCRVLFSDSPKRSFASYLEDEKPDLVIIPTRSKRGVFESSFASYINRHTTSHVLLLKQ